jgi:hypothetical protein
MRRRVYRLYQPITLLGLELWHIPVIGMGFSLGLRLLDPVHPILGLLGGAVVGWVFLMMAEKLRERYPGAALLHEAVWMGQSDNYVPGKDRETTPLRFYGRSQE